MTREFYVIRDVDRTVTPKSLSGLLFALLMHNTISDMCLTSLITCYHYLFMVKYTPLFPSAGTPVDSTPVVYTLTRSVHF